ncbi:uncharacterized protein SPSK_04023 [Sporothrix schenckii 1099-18]|nr:uncharacterized protein SPSK_04023 [Sporothrix schenckii 1099-18]KJR83628.1 hypothetical protein SPSK_04023 [Sporothrix schenckii 1099-18]
MDSLHLVPEDGDAHQIPLQLQVLSQANLQQHTLNTGADSTPHLRNPFQPPSGHHHEHHQHHRHQHHHIHHDEMAPPADRRPRKLVLCFDGTGNKFRGDDSDSNILKIFRMLDRTADDQYHYYQPGIGTYVVSSGLSNTSTRARIRSWYMKAKDSAVGSSFDQHVVGGYRFLMRFYNPGDEIYLFGFSRGAYIARFLAEMLDYVGLLTHGNEEMVHFAWKAFSQWQCRRSGSGKNGGADKKKEMYTFMKGFRETFSRPVRRIQFLGLFDTVNSVPRFETAWMERSKFPYTARSSAKVIRHAVSIDERRAKFRQDLVYQGSGHSAKKQHRDPRQVLHDVHEKYRARRVSLQAAVSSAIRRDGGDSRVSQDHDRVNDHDHDVDDDDDVKKRGRQTTRLSDVAESGDGTDDPENPAPYRPHSRSVSCESRGSGRGGAGGSSGGGAADIDNADLVSEYSNVQNNEDDDDDVPQDLSEVWFSGDHGDIGGGWEMTPGTKSASHVPLTWMVREAMRAGLNFDAEKVVAMGCSDVLENQWAPSLRDDVEAAAHNLHTLLSPSAALHQAHVPEISVAPDAVEPVIVVAPPPTVRINSPDETMASGSQPTTAGSERKLVFAATGGAAPNDGKPDKVRLSTSPRQQFHDMMHKAHNAPIHDSLQYGGGLSKVTVTAWNIMEYMPFRRMDLQADGSWKPIRWPLPCGEVRDIPNNVYVHGSVVRRMKQDPSYRPGNLIVGGGGRGCRVAPAHYGMGDWECIAEAGDPIGELWVKKAKIGE